MTRLLAILMALLMGCAGTLAEEADLGAEEAGTTAVSEALDPEGDEEGEDEAPDPAGLGYLGEWRCGDVALEIIAVDGRYEAQLRRPNDDGTAVEWVYDCEAEGDALLGRDGAKYIIFSNEAGLEISSVVEYDGGTARFVLTPDGGMTWRDDVEDAGRDLVFERLRQAGADQD